MYYIKINGKDIWPYEWIMHSDNSIEWDILPIIYDNAIIELYKNSENRYSLCYKKSKNLFWKEIKYTDIVNENSWETFSLQTDNIFVAKIDGNDIKIICKVWEEIKMYSNFWKQEILIESDWDKTELTPLGYYDMFVRYDNNFYYAINLDSQKQIEITKFIDYFGFKSYEDDNWNNHFVMLIEQVWSTDTYDMWNFVDNFNIISERIDFGNDEEYVENWELDWNWNINIKTTMQRDFYVDTSKKLIQWKINLEQNTFYFTRFFEDTDSDFIVWKNKNWLFIINRTKTNLNKNQIENLVYFKNFIASTTYNDFTFFLMETFDQEIVVVNENQALITHSDIHDISSIKNFVFISENLIEITLNSWEERQYII